MSRSRWNTSVLALMIVLVGATGGLFGVRPAMAACSSSISGPIKAKYDVLGGEAVIGCSTTGVRPTPRGDGEYAHFRSPTGAISSIYWKYGTPEAFRVYGLIRSKWAVTNWELGPLGWPQTDERDTPDRTGRYNLFEGGGIYWKTSAPEAFFVINGFWRTWGQLNYERGPLGFPTRDEYSPDGVKAIGEFEHGTLYWTQNYNVWVQLNTTATYGASTPSISSTTTEYYLPGAGSGLPGVVVKADGQGFTPGSQVTLYLDTPPWPWHGETLTVGPDGAVRFTQRSLIVSCVNLEPDARNRYIPRTVRMQASDGKVAIKGISIKECSDVFF
jgi:hypothetical protein